MLPGLVGTIQTVKREQRFAHSKFDFLVETDADEQAFVEVKGMTLENKGIGAFPDAPTLRGLKHVTELMAATKRVTAVTFCLWSNLKKLSKQRFTKRCNPPLLKMWVLQLIKVCKSLLTIAT